LVERKGGTVRRSLLTALALLVPSALVLVSASFARPVLAFPAFAKKYGMSCSACHLAWPIFNPQGQSFRDNGYQFGLGKDDPITLSQAYAPFALRTTPAYQYTRTTNQPGDGVPVTIETGGVPIPPGADILTGGTIAKDISFLVVAAGFGEDGTASLESAWARLDNLAGSGWLNLRIGKFELDLPASAHRGVSLTYGYAGYAGHPTGSLVPFDMGENQVGLELDGHNSRSTTRYALSFTSVNGGEGLSGNAWSSPMVYGHVQQAFDLGNAIVPWIRVGALGGVGWWPTEFSQDADGVDIPGTGSRHETFTRAGAELSWMMGYPSTPAFFTAAYLYGSDDAALIQPNEDTGEDFSGRSSSFNSGFVELDWVPFSNASYVATPLLLFARYDLVRYEHGSGDVDGGTLGLRHYLALGPRASAAIHVEGHFDRVKGVGFNGDGTTRDVETTSALAGIDFDF
jgi:hypothetical protein